MILSVMIVTMKRYFFLFIASVFLAFGMTLSPSPEREILTARAENERYAVAENPDVWFYKTESEEEKLFCIPRTYYVKVLSQGEKFSLCEYLKDSDPYKKISGYCLTNALTFVDFTPRRPYLFREVTVEYVLPVATPLGSGTFVSKKETYVYYGNRYENGQLHFYVGTRGEYGYIPASEELVYELNTDYLPEPVAPATSANATAGLSAVQIVLITLSAVSVLVIAVFVARGKKSFPSERFEP